MKVDALAERKKGSTFSPDLIHSLIGFNLSEITDG